MTKSIIGILGCGWLGLPLAMEFIGMNHQVKGSTTSTKKLDTLTEKGIHPYLIKLNESHIEGDIDIFLSDIEVLVINVPPKFRNNPESNYLKKMELLGRKIKKFQIKKLILISSTAVYGEQEGIITEETLPKPKKKSAQQLVRVEEFYKTLCKNTTIVRFGGLIGPERHPVYRLSQKEDLKNGDELVNLIHLNDCINMIKTIVENNYWNEVFNGVYPEHPTKKEYYSREAMIRKVRKPKYSSTSEKILLKRVKSEKFLNKGHSFLTSILS